MKFIGLAICLGTVVGAAATAGIHLYFDILSCLLVLGGAIGFLVLKKAGKSSPELWSGCGLFRVDRHSRGLDCNYRNTFFRLGGYRKDGSGFSRGFADCFVWLYIEAGDHCSRRGLSPAYS